MGIELSHWCVGVISRRRDMVLPLTIHVAAERHDFDSVLEENGVVKMEVSHWYLGVISRREGMVLPQLTSLATERGGSKS